MTRRTARRLIAIAAIALAGFTTTHAARPSQIAGFLPPGPLVPTTQQVASFVPPGPLSIRYGA